MWSILGSTALFALVETYACGCAFAVWQLQPPLGSLLPESVHGVWRQWSCRKRSNYVALIFIISEHRDPLFISASLLETVLWHLISSWAGLSQRLALSLCLSWCLLSWIKTIPPSSCWFACCYIWKLFFVCDWSKQQFSLIVPAFKVSTAF